MLITLSILLGFALVIVLFVSQKKFGNLPSGERLERVKKSPHYKNGSFQNLSHTPSLTEGVSYYSVMKEFFYGKKLRVKPGAKLPSVKTDLLKLDPRQDVLVWFGHSSYFIQIDGKKILVDPVFCGAASPIASTTRSFEGADIYSADDMPDIDYLIMSHDHWDHADYETIVRIRPKVKQVICGLGFGAHLERWGYRKLIIVEKDWNETVNLSPGFVLHTTPARHFSGRGFSRNKSLWMSYVLKTPTFNLYLGGDSGYDSHFAEIGSKFGPFDLVILENGQYDKSWKYIHMLPEEIVPAAKDLRAKRLLPVHSAKFALGNHPWDEPLRKVSENAKGQGIKLLTPMIGEQVNLKDENQQFTEWWKGIP